MTDEERQELSIHLRQMSRSLDFYSPEALRRAAAELERLAGRVSSLETCAALNLQEAELLAKEHDELRTQLK